MSSFTQQPMYEGEPVVDYTEYWWARSPATGDIHWAMPNGPRSKWEPVPWTFPEWDGDEFHEPDFHAHFQQLSNGVAWEYSLWIDREVQVPEGLLFRTDPQVGTGYQWALFDPEKEVLPG